MPPKSPLIAVISCVLIIGLASGVFPVGSAAARVMPDPASLDPEALQVLERELAAELLALNLQMLTLQEDREQLEQRLADLAVISGEEKQKLAAARDRLEATRGRLGGWVRYLYEDGRLSLVGMVLQAQNVADFFRRLEFARILIEYEADLLSEVRTLNASIQERLYQLAALEAETARAKDRVASQMVELERVQNKRTEFLETIRAQSTGLAERLAGLERQWQESLVPLHNLLGQLNVVLARDLQPDRIYFQGRNMLIEIGAPAINKALAKAAGDTLDSIRVDVDTRGITVTSIGRDGRAHFRVFGRLAPVADGKSVVFQSENLIIDGMKMEARSLPFLTEDQGSFALGDQFQFMNVIDIAHEKDKIRFTLRRN